jgi:hypothetical protein
MARRQRDELPAPAVEERVARDEERPGVQLSDGGKGGVDLAFAANPKDMGLHSLSARRFLHSSDDQLGISHIRVYE